ncbi:uncharacterized protein LOC142353887 [Convolutriloba macropyga]|uniref:uncharacterized protein LOC142353887 n=1 Tax=Convolutriloba macropyga TaxID=536237 RepID=UPI003F521637
MTGLIINVLGYFSAHKRIYFFLSGVFFVIAGLFIILSLVTYAATTNSIAEGWPSVIGKSPAEMQYSYGWSFFLCGFSLLSSEGAGVFALYYFLAASSHIYKTSLTTDFKQVCSPSSPMHGILRNATGGTSNITGGGSSGPTTAAVNGGAYTMTNRTDSEGQSISAATSTANFLSSSEDTTDNLFTSRNNNNNSKPFPPPAVTFYPFFIPNGENVNK